MTVICEAGLERRFRALGDGNSIRMSRAALRRRMKAQGRRGALMAADLLDANVDVLRSLDIGDFLLWVPYFGKTKARALLESVRVSPWCEIDELSPYYRRKIVGALVVFGEGGS